MRVGDPNLTVEELPSFDEERRMLLQPKKALDYQVIKRGQTRRKVWQFLVLWLGVPREEASSKDYDEMRLRFSKFTLEDKGTLEKMGNDKNPRRKGVGRENRSD